jgi:phage replication O-like protein O
MTLPNYTQVSNEFIAMMPDLTGEEIKIFLAISRKTIGWHKTSDRISYSQLKALTGISRHETLRKCTLSLAEKRLIEISGDHRGGYTYDLAMLSDSTEKAGGVLPDSTGPMLPDSTTIDTEDKKEEKTKILPTEVAPPSGAAPSPIPFDLAKIAGGVEIEEAIRETGRGEVEHISPDDGGEWWVGVCVEFCDTCPPREVYYQDGLFMAHDRANFEKRMRETTLEEWRKLQTLHKMAEFAPDINVGTKTAAPAVAPPPDPRKALEKALMAKFEAIQPDGRFPSQNYAKEWKGVRRLVTEAMGRQPDNPEAWLGGYFAAWKRLQRDRKTLIHGQPDTPSKMAAGGFIDYVVAEMAQGNLMADDFDYSSLHF